jgi:hypothetical protein
MKLFAVLLGGSGVPGRLSEDHETVFVIAEDERSAKKAAKAKWAGYGRPHVDALVSLDHVDGFDISVVPGGTVPEGAFVSYNDLPHDEED